MVIDSIFKNLWRMFFMKFRFLKSRLLASGLAFGVAFGICGPSAFAMLSIRKESGCKPVRRVGSHLVSWSSTPVVGPNGQVGVQIREGYEYGEYSDLAYESEYIWDTVEGTTLSIDAFDNISPFSALIAKAIHEGLLESVKLFAAEYGVDYKIHFLPVGLLEASTFWRDRDFSDLQSGDTILSVAFTFGRKNIATWLVEHGATVTPKGAWLGRIPFFEAVKLDDPALLQHCIDNGADIHCCAYWKYGDKMQYGNALDVALKYDKQNAVAFLQSQGLNPTPKSELGCTIM